MVEKFIGRKWDKTAKWLDSHIHLFALADANDIPARDVVQAYKDAGINAAMGVMCAHLYIMENGPDAGVAMAVKIYQDICTEIRYSRSRGAMRRKAEALMYQPCQNSWQRRMKSKKARRQAANPDRFVEIFRDTLKKA